ncbi:MAG TPA: hypothetical protein VF435_02100 [Pyrinomonadaceae bacterium]
MKEDYLWDKTGEPDPEIQQLEEILGALRYQPKPLELPQDLLTPRRETNHFPLVAIAATVLLALLAAGVWLRVRTQGESQPKQASVTPTSSTTVAKKDDEEPKQQKIEQVRNSSLPPLPRHAKHRSSSTALVKRERDEALAAKEQVMLALRLTTEKLSLVHKKTQNPSNQIKNQHRTG